MKLSNHSAVVVSISGGKDSQTILGKVMDEVKSQAYQGKVLAIHGDTGAEWRESLPHCEMLCKSYGVQLEVATPIRTLTASIEARCRKLQAENKKGGFPSSACRYCTSDHKRNPIQKVVRQHFGQETTQSILHVTGERREESSGRAKLPEVETNAMLTTKKRTVINWRPILDMKTPDIWAYIKSTGLPRHVAYDRGNARLSCAICVLATDADIRRGAVARPDLAEDWMRIERETGHTMKNGKSLAEILHPVKIQNDSAMTIEAGDRMDCAKCEQMELF